MDEPPESSKCCVLSTLEYVPCDAVWLDAIKNNDLACLRVLSQEEVTRFANVGGFYGYYTPLGYALYERKIDVIKFLVLEKGVSVDEFCHISHPGFHFNPVASIVGGIKEGKAHTSDKRIH
jgi:hypothetical protein